MLNTVLIRATQIYYVSTWNDRFCVQGYFKALTHGKLKLVICVLIMELIVGARFHKAGYISHS